MAVDALQLRPRSAVALFDASVRLCATSSGPWALTLPAGAALVAALLHLADAAHGRRPLLGPVLWWTLAWVFRAVSQAAACHYLEGQLLTTAEPSVRASFRAALGKLPRLITTAATLAVIDGLLWVTTAGLGLLFVGAHHVGYAVAMRGEGHPLALYGTCSRLLGAARHSAPWVRLCGLTQLLLGFNLHLAAAMGLSLGQQLLGLDVTFLDRFASLDNPTWLATVAIVTFALFEPVRAATATLLLVDGRVRQEGLDLLAQVEQLPSRKRARAPGLLAVLALSLGTLPAWGASHEELAQRLGNIVDECGLDVRGHQVEQLRELPARDQAALDRFVRRLENLVFDQGDCSAAGDELKRGLGEVKAMLGQASAETASTSREAAQRILARPEFQERPEARADDPEVKPDTPPAESNSWFEKLFERFLKWLRDLMQRRDEQAPPPITPPSLSGEMTGANVVMFVVLAAVVGVLAFVIWRSLPRKKVEEAGADSTALDVSPLSSDPQSALSRTPETWAGLADELAAQGRFREATRHLYLALLSRLHREGAIDYDPTSSNWDYLRAFRGPGAWKPPFRELTHRFDFAWYGRLEVGHAAFHEFRALAEPMLAPPPGGPTGA